MSNGSADQPPSAARRPRLKLSAVVLGLVCGALLAAVLGTAALVTLARGGTARLTEERFEAAFERWQEADVESYNLDLVLAGRESATIHLEVRQGEPTEMTRDGRRPSRRVWEYWTIPEQFEMIRRELTADPRTAFGASDRDQVILRAEFDPRLGYPRKYEREVLGQDASIRWEIVAFEEVR